VPDRDDVTLVEGPLFRLDQIEGLANEDVATRYGAGPLLVIPRKGTARIGIEAILPGGCGLAPDLDQVAFDENGLCLIAQPLDA
jgi:mannose-6-phosphate isomerase